MGSDLPGFSFQSCLTQRNLSETGRWQAVSYGDILRSLRIPVQYPIVSSPFCRNIETAQLAFGTVSVGVDPFLFEVYRLSGNLPDEERNRILNGLQSRLKTAPDQGWNQVIIGHSFPAQTGLGEIPNMGTVIVKPGGAGNGYQVVRRLSLSELRAIGN
ncbi:histidine phosphatase family protein [Jeotgalibacillus salarius]|uniref:histidine phosphatase family protein n=1 Tax=Jeotgalibacillus salarius TaxID=546023 RepID=UPI003C7EC726